MIEHHQTEHGVKPLCTAFFVSRATFYRSMKNDSMVRISIKESPRRILEHEETIILETLNSERFLDLSPAEICAILLDEGTYLCSERTMYRILSRHEQNVERRNRVHHNFSVPVLLAKNPNQLWSWDITKLKGPQKWTYYYLYTILDIFSRYVVGWMVAYRQIATLAKELIAESCLKQNIEPGQLKIHSDRGKQMQSKTLAQLLIDLGIIKSFSRPHVPDDNPYSESHFGVLKGRPEFPDRFGCIYDARSFCRKFYNWYNNEHRHSGIGMLTPSTVHYGKADMVLAKRQLVLEEAYKKYPERFVKGKPEVKRLQQMVWINKPKN